MTTRFPAAEAPGRRRATAIERAGIAPSLPLVRSAPPLQPPLHTPAVPLLALVHDGADDDLLGAMTAGIGAALTGSDMALVLHDLRRGGPSALPEAFLHRHRPAGVILAPRTAHRDELAALCRRAATPCLPLGGSEALARADRAAAAGIVTWLVVQGHVRIALVAGPDASPIARRRELGYLDAMAEHGLDRGPALIVPGDDSFASGIEAGRLLLEISPRPSAIVACNDEMAAGVLHAAAQARVAVPRQLSVVGFDDTPLAARTLPALTVMHVPWHDLARDAAQRLLGGQTAADDAFAPRLVVRDSVAPLA